MVSIRHAIIYPTIVWMLETSQRIILVSGLQRIGT